MDKVRYKIREYQDSDKKVLQDLIESLMDFVVSTDPIKRIRRMSGYGPKNLKKTFWARLLLLERQNCR